MKDTYTTALLDLLATTADAEAVLKGFKDTLTKRGHEQLYGPVLRRVLTRLKAARPTTMVVVASETAYEAQKAAITKALTDLGGNEPVVVVDDTIVGGFIAEHNHTRLDASFKTKLVSLYRSLTR